MPSRSSEPSPDDAALVAAARDGDHDAFGELVTRHQRRIWMVCRSYLGPDEADCATQDAFVKAWSSLARFDGRAAFTTWLTRIAINTCLDEIRRRRREGARLEVDGEEDGGDGPLDRLADGDAGPESRSIHRQAVARLARCERDLPPRQREIFRLRFYGDLELDQIAGALGVHVGTVKTQLHRAVHRLRQELGDVR